MTDPIADGETLENWYGKERTYTVEKIVNVLKQFEYTEGLDKKIVFNGTAVGLANKIALTLEIPDAAG